ncbi:MAG: uroporphyrinogen decarboxylase family protein, partial [Candidatus Thermoplasmatota archaeon]|nr:uroporphyrinogen decarboxylase family protein [Candidatus Thermoplasmatota archaeon]
DSIARLGFAGCPWTTSMYLLAGGTGDKEFHNTRATVFSNPDEAQRVLLHMAEAVGDLLADQVNHGGADAVQLFDTWAGLLSVEDYHRIALPATQRAIEVFRERAERRVPLIHYAKGSGHLHEAIRTLDIDALSLDWRDDLRANRASFGDRFAFQGNLDPSRMHGTPEAARTAAQRVLNEAGDAPGHVFNLGHGFAPGAQIDCVEAVLRLITGESA